MYFTNTIILRQLCSLWNCVWGSWQTFIQNNVILMDSGQASWILGERDVNSFLVWTHHFQGSAPVQVNDHDPVLISISDGGGRTWEPEQGEIGNISISHREREMKGQLQRWDAEYCWQRILMRGSPGRLTELPMTTTKMKIKITDTLAGSFTYTISFLSSQPPHKVSVMNFILQVMTDLELKPWSFCGWRLSSGQHWTAF